LRSDAVCAVTDTVTSNVINLNVDPTPPASVTPAGITYVCAGDSFPYQASASTGGYLWSNGATTQHVEISVQGNYSLTVTDALGCTASSSQVTLTFYTPVIPVITLTGNTLLSTPAAAYQWFRNDSLLPGATAQHLTISLNGFYQVEITDTNGCQDTSTVLDITTLGIEQLTAENAFELYPNPNNGNFTLSFPSAQTGFVSLFDITGRLIAAPQPLSLSKQFDYSTLNNGVYLLEIESNNIIRTLRLVIEK
jgi:hypothetical protein